MLLLSYFHKCHTHLSTQKGKNPQLPPLPPYTYINNNLFLCLVTNTESCTGYRKLDYKDQEQNYHVSKQPNLKNMKTEHT